MALKNYMWFPVLIALGYTIYSNDIYREIANKALTGDISGAYKLYKKSEEYIKDANNENGEISNSALKLFTHEELARFETLENGLYLAIIGQVFDVTEGSKHYGPGGSYHAFTGKDASKSFISGEFTIDELTDDTDKLTNSQAKSMDDWIKFYHEKYIFKGKLVGRYYDQNGNPTAAYYEFEEKVRKAREDNSAEEQQKKMFPPCNIEWSPENGTRVWCTKLSGGIARDWLGVPRQYFENHTELKSRCACVNLESKEYKENIGSFREYENCPDDSSTCYIKT